MTRIPTLLVLCGDATKPSFLRLSTSLVHVKKKPPSKRGTLFNARLRRNELPKRFQRGRG